MATARPLIGCLVVWLACLGTTFAQLTTGDIVGRITDESGAVLPGATVAVENIGTGLSRSATASATGDYVFSLLPIGTYTVRIELQGFQTQTTQVTLATGDRTRVDARLQLGTVEERVVVTGEAPLLQTDTSTMRALLTEQAVQDLPINGRNITRLVQLVPGAFEGFSNSKAGGNVPDDRRQTSAVSINGAMDNLNNQLIDGMDNNERAIGTISVKPAVDAIAEVQVQTNMYTAEVGRTAGGVINLITKSGTNTFHGSLFEYLRDDRFDARNYFAPRNERKPDFRQDQYGGSLGGRILRDRTFFFADYERFQQRQGVTTVVTVPTANMRSGDLSQITTPIFDPLATPRTPFPGNVIPVDRIDPIAAQLLTLYPLPTGPGLANNYTGLRYREQKSHTADVRIDHRFDDRQSIFARYSINDVYTFTPPVFPAVDDIEPGGGGSFPGPNDTRAHSIAASYLRVFSPTLIAEIRGSYLDVNIASYPLNYGNDVMARFGVPNINIDSLTSGLSSFTFSGFAGIGDANFVPLLQVDHTSQIGGSVTKTSGPHTLKFGGSFIDRRFGVVQSSTPKGAFTFDTLVTSNGAGVGGNSMASFLLGYPSQVTRSHALIDPHYRTWEPSLYVQDDWRATSWLTLNLGLRYDIFSPFTERDNLMSNLNLDSDAIFDVPSGPVVLTSAGEAGLGRTVGVETDYSNLAPRLGFSATLPNRIVIRGGFGLTYFPANSQSQSVMKNPPFTSVYGPVNSAAASGGAPTLLLANGLPLPTPTDPNNLSGSLQAVPTDFRSTRMRQYNLLFEREVFGSVLGAGYLGWKGDFMVGTGQANPTAIGSGNMNLAPPGSGAIQPRRRFSGLLPNVNSISLLAPIYEGHYNALQITFQRRQRQGLTFSGSYTLAEGQNESYAPWDSTVIERFNADLVARHRWVFTANYHLPWGEGLTGLTRGLLQGWQVNAVLFMQTGLPFTIQNGTALSNTGGVDRPNQLSDPTLDNPTIQMWFNTAAFEAQPINTVGDAQRNELYGPSSRRLDLSLFKHIALVGPTRLQVRAEIFNVTNTPSFAQPNANFGTGGFGTITAINGNMRQIQFAAKLLF